MALGGFVALDASLYKERRRRALQIETDTLSSYIQVTIITAMTTAASDTTAAARGEKKRQPTRTTKLGQQQHIRQQQPSYGLARFFLRGNKSNKCSH